MIKQSTYHGITKWWEWSITEVARSIDRLPLKETIWDCSRCIVWSWIASSSSVTHNFTVQSDSLWLFHTSCWLWGIGIQRNSFCMTIMVLGTIDQQHPEQCLSCCVGRRAAQPHHIVLNVASSHEQLPGQEFRLWWWLLCTLKWEATEFYMWSVLTIVAPRESYDNVLIVSNIWWCNQRPF